MNQKITYQNICMLLWCLIATVGRMPAAHAQPMTVRGIVVDADHLPLTGASIRLPACELFNTLDLSFCSG
ncbi:hypothetical protein JHJ32_15070 [Parapedobacter sp. ISTM3]|uniref:hypothetical protein n=1 Tax=Parapedobacter sp. ISTM3 TaxID=2800130 RepID=UPI0019036C88|nr:hypothetical protein [Parapedobacter sp. ISTM3]MBK1441319.1 hypothetical protein [Parapedobacter sp. ISTM3]